MSRRAGFWLIPVVFILAVAWPTLGSDDAESLFERGRELMADRQYQKAAGVLNDLTTRYPNAAEADEALLLLGKAHLLAKHYDQALAAFEHLLHSRGKSAWTEKARLLMADAYAASGRHELAADILKRRLETVEGRAYKLMLADHYLKVAAAAFEGVPSTDPLKKGEKERDLEKAVTYYTRARDLLQGEPEEAELTVKIARARFDAGRADKTVETLTGFFERFADYAHPAEVRLLKARAHQERGQTEPARRELKDFVKPDGLFHAEATRPEALQLLAETWFKDGGERAVSRGVAVLADAIQAYPKNPRTVAMAYRLGEALFQAGKLRESVTALTAFRDRYPESKQAPDATLHVADAYFRMKNYQAARTAWRTFISRNPNHPRWATAQRRIVEALFAAAEDQRQAGRPDQAVTAFQTFLADYPADKLSPRAEEAIARIHEKAGRVDAALEAYAVVATRYAELDRGAAARCQFQRATLLRLKKEDLDATMEALKDLLKRFPRTTEAREARALIARLGSRALRVETERVYSLQEPAQLKVATRNLDKLEFKAYPISLVDYFKKKHGVDRIESVEVAIIKPAVAWTEPTPGYARYKDIERAVDLGRLKELAPKGGAFIVAVRGEDLETRTLAILSDLTVVLKKSPQQGLAFVLDEAAGRPAAGVEVLLSDGRKIVGQGRTDGEGVFVKRFGKFVPDLRVLAHRGEHVAFAGGKSREAYTFGYKTKVYLYTDRPRYRPGHTVHLKGIARKVEDGVYRTPRKALVDVKVLDSRGAVLLNRKLTANEFGTFSEELDLGSAAPLGTYRITARFDRLDFDASFEVAEYKKPDMFVRVQPDRPDYLNGERVKATLEAGYFFGGPARQAAVTWRVFRAPYVFDAASYEEYAWFFEEKKVKEGTGHDLGEFVTHGQGTTDDEGRLPIAFNTGDKEGDWRYTVVAEVQGRGRQVAYGSSVLFLTERAYYTMVRADKKAYQPRETIRVAVTTVNARHEPVARTGKVELIRLTHARGKTQETVEAESPVTTGPDGKGRVELEAPRGGTYLIRYSGPDRREETVTGRTRVAVAGEAEDLSRQARIVAEREIYYTGDHARVLVNTPHAPAWALLTFEGEKVLDHRVIRLERRSNLLDLEMKGSYSPNVFLRVAVPADRKLYEDEDEVLVFKFLKVTVQAAKPEYRPGEKAQVTVVATDPKGKPVQTELSLAVVDRSLLAISPDQGPAIKPFFYDQKRRRSVTTSSSYAFRYQGQTTKVDPDLLGLEAREKLREELEKLQERAKGAYPGPSGSVPPDMIAPSARARLAKGFALEAEKKSRKREMAPAKDARSGSADFFFGRKPGQRAGDKAASRENRLADRLARLDEMAVELHDADAPAESGRGLFDARVAEQLASVQVRRRFLDTAAFLPHVVTDAEGRAEMEFTLPDNLTAWRARAVGVGGDALVGQGDAVFRVKKPLVVRLDTPRFLTQGDRVRVATVLHNNTEQPMNLTTELTVKGADLEGRTRAPTTLPAFEAGRLDWDLTAPRPGAVTFSCKAVDAHATDGVEQGLPCLPFGVRGRAAHAITTTENVEFEVKLPDRLLPDACTYQLLISPGYDAVILDSLDYLDGFPYGCIEQTVSRFLPAVVALRALDRLGVDDPARTKRLYKQVQAGLARLYHMQHPDGGWGWWFRKVRGGKPHGGSDPRMTAYALFGLETARTTGYAVDPGVLDRARRQARDMARKVPGYDLRAALLYALSVSQQATVSELNRAYRYRDLLAAGGLSKMALAYTRMNHPRYAANLVDLLEARVRRQGALAWWPCAGKEKGAWDRSPLETTAWALSAILAVKPDSTLVEPALAYLMQHRQGRAFRSTRDTASVLLALAATLEKQGLEQADYNLSVEVNGHKAESLAVRKGRLDAGRRTLSLDPALFKPGTNKIRIIKAGPGKIHLAFAADYTTPADEVEAHGHVLQAKRAYRPHADPEDRGEDWVRPGWSVVVSKFRPAEQVEPDLRELRAGDKARVALNVHAREPLAYVVVEDPLPAGFEVVEDSAEGPFDRFERRDNRVVFFFSRVSGRVKVSYVIRAVHPGTFRALPPFAAPMYEPALWGRGASATFTVHDPDAGVNLTRAERKPTADELYYGALKDIEKNRKESARTRLKAVRAFRLRDEILDEVLAHLVRLDLDQAPREAVSAYEELLERNVKKAEFERGVRIRLARAYHELKEYERAAGFYRQLLQEAFERERQLVQSYVELGEPAKAQQVLLRVLRRYPDANAVVAAWYRRGLHYADIPDPELARQPYLKTGVPTMRLEALRELKAFTGYYPESPLAADAQYHVVSLLDKLRNHARAVAEARRFYQRYPKSRWLDDVMFLEVQSLYAAGHYDAALEAGQTLVENRFPREDGRKGTVWSPWRDHALYLFGKISHIQGDLTRAVSYYRRVANQFEDARDALAFFTRAELTVKPTYAMALNQASTVDVELKNLRSVKGRIYPVDLKVLFAVRKNLTNINAIDLTGIPAVATFEETFKDAPDYVRFTRPLRLPLKDKGVYLVVLKSGTQDTSTIVVRSDLELRVQRVGSKVRAYVTSRSTGSPVSGAFVRVADGRTIKAEGPTDPRGVFEGPNIRGKASFVVEHQGSFAFHQEGVE